MTVPTNSDHAIQAVRDRKMNKPNTDQHLIGELENRGLNVSFRTLEIGFLGHHERHAIHCICHTFNLPKHDANQILLKLARTSVSCYYHISTAETLRAGTQTSLLLHLKLSFLKLIVLTLFHVVSVMFLHHVLLCALPSTHLGGSTLCIQVPDCIAHSMLYYEGISSP